MQKHLFLELKQTFPTLPCMELLVSASIIGRIDIHIEGNNLRVLTRLCSPSNKFQGLWWQYLQIEDVYDTVYETCGQYWPYIHLYILIAIILMQITMIGLFGLKAKPAASISTIPLLLFTLMFNEYCKKRFLPSFHHYSIQVYLVLYNLFIFHQEVKMVSQ